MPETMSELTYKQTGGEYNQRRADMLKNMESVVTGHFVYLFALLSVRLCHCCNHVTIYGILVKLHWVVYNQRKVCWPHHTSSKATVTVISHRSSWNGKGTAYVGFSDRFCFLSCYFAINQYFQIILRFRISHKIPDNNWKIFLFSLSFTVNFMFEFLMYVLSALAFR